MELNEAASRYFQYLLVERGDSPSSIASYREDLLAFEKERPELVIIDSIQTMYSEEVASAPGSAGR